MSSYLPPVFRGKIPTTPGRLLLAAAAMLALDLFCGLGTGVIAMNFCQVVALIVVLLLSPRRWVAFLLMLPASAFFLPVFCVPDELADMLPAMALWLGTFIAYPRPRYRVVYVEEEEELPKG